MPWVQSPACQVGVSLAPQARLGHGIGCMLLEHAVDPSSSSSSSRPWWQQDMSAWSR